MTPWKEKRVYVCSARSDLPTSPHLFSLMVRLSHFDVRDQVPTRAGVLDMRHCDHQVIEGGTRGLFGLTQLRGGGGVQVLTPVGYGV